MKLKVLIIFLFFGISFKATGQTLEVYNREINIPKDFTYDEFTDGLQDSAGFIWLSTSKGALVKYDNQELKRFGTEHGLPAGGRWNLYEDSENNIFIHINWTDLNKKRHFIFNAIEEKAISLESYTNKPPPFNENHVRKVTQNSDGSIWFYLFNGDIFELYKKQVTYWGTVKDDSGHNAIFKSFRSLAYTFQGVEDKHYMVITSPNMSGQKRYETPNGYGFNRFLGPSIFESKKDGALAMFTDLNTNSKKLILCTYDGIEVLDSVIDKAADYKIFDNKIWRVSNEKGILLDQRMEVITTWAQPRSDSFLFFDKQSGWWTAGSRGKLKRMYTKRSKFHHYNHSIANLPWYTAARGIIATKKGELFISKGGSLTKINTNGEVEFLHPPWTTATSGDYYGLHIEEGTDYLWVANGTTLDKFNLITGEFEQSHHLGKQLNSVVQSYHDQLGQFWAGGSYGMSKLDTVTGEFEKFEGYPGYGLPDKLRVFHFYENESGMWVATGEGLFLFDITQKTIERFYLEGEGINYLPHDVISHLQEDENGWFWLASKGGGLIHWNPLDGVFEQYTTDNGLRNNVIYACYQDEYDQVWLPSDNGLMRFDKNTKQVIHYTENDGIPDREFNTVSHHEDSLGNLYFGGLKGVIKFHPKDFIPQENPYTITLTDYFKTNANDSVYATNRSEVLVNHTFSILPDDKEVSLSFALLNFENSDEWEYAYKLDGLHQEWKALEQPNVILSALPYGNYTLHFRCKIEGYNWATYKHPIRISVIAPYYLTWWFWTFAIISFVGIIWLLLRWRLSAGRKREEELEHQVALRTKEISAQAEELKSLDKMKTQFFANISHELRTPLTLIIGPVQEMKSKKNPHVDPFELRSNLDVIDRNAKRLLGLVEEVLDLSKLEAGKLSVNETAINLLDFTRFIKSNFEPIAELNEINYHINFMLSAKQHYFIDQPKVETILTNLLSNAFKFCGEKGTVILTVEEKGELILFNVTDKGIGIKATDIPFVFDRFYQVKSDNNTAQGGTGIGLSLSQELAKLMNGEIRVESEFGIGSTFSLEIPKKLAPEKISTSPLTKAEFEHKTVPKTELIEQEKPVVLLVEDTPDMADYIKSILKTNYSVITANNGKKGLDILEKDHYKIDLIISDVMMPIMDGFTMLSEIKTHEALFNIPIIMLTARASETDKLQALTIGADDYLTKPFSSSELLSRIKNLITNYENRKLWQNDMTQAVKSISKQGDVAPNDESKKTHEAKESLKISKKDLIWLKDVEKLIKKELQNEAFNVQSLAEEMFLSKRQFERKIKGVTGLTPAKLVLEIRLNVGRKFLEDGHYLSVSEVSYAIGIQTPSYFSKVYAKRFGRKPSSYFE